MDYSELLISVGYLLMLGAMACRDVLWLRLFLIVAQAVLAYYQFRYGSVTAGYWNCVFVFVNAVQVVAILRDRAHRHIPARYAEIYAQIFSHLSPAEFCRLVEPTTEVEIDDDLILECDQVSDKIYLLLDGEAEVSLKGRRIATLRAGTFIGEMSFLSGRKTSARVQASGAASLLRWDSSTIEQLEEVDPGLYRKFKDVLSHDLVEKMLASSAAIRIQEGHEELAS